MINQDILNRFAIDPNDKLNCLQLAEEYYKVRQWSASVTYFLKAIEACNDEDYDLKYHCLLRICTAYTILGNRRLGALQYARFAKAECPDRPEAYFAIADIIASNLTENNQLELGEWIQVYENTRIGCMYAKIHDRPKTEFYYGLEGLYALYLMSLLRLGKLIELRQLLSELTFTDTDNRYVMNILDYIYMTLMEPNPYNMYNKSKKDKFIYQFESLDKIEFNYARSMQDMFVLSMLDGKSNGTYLEFEFEAPIQNNNTYLLKSVFNWTGTCYLSKQESVDAVKCMREDVDNVMNFNPDSIVDLDYLSINNPDTTKSISLLTELESKLDRIKIITVKHDAALNGNENRIKLNDILNKTHYLIGDNMKFNKSTPYEDWYISKSLLDEDTLIKVASIFKQSGGDVIKAFFNK